MPLEYILITILGLAVMAGIVLTLFCYWRLGYILAWIEAVSQPQHDDNDVS